VAKRETEIKEMQINQNDFSRREKRKRTQNVWNETQNKNAKKETQKYAKSKDEK